MTSPADNSVHGGIELSSLAAISHAVDEQKNRNAPKKKKFKRKNPKQQVEKVIDGVDNRPRDDEDRHVIDYLA